MSSVWTVEFKPSAFKELKKLPKPTQAQTLEFLDKLITEYPSPHTIGSPLQGQYNGFWRYRIDNYRLICEIKDSQLVVLVLGVAHRKDIYTKQSIPAYITETQNRSH